MEDNRVNGMIIKPAHPNAPDFVKCSISVKVDEFITYLKLNDNNGWVNLDMLKSKEGKLYVKLNDWKPDNQQDYSPKTDPAHKTTAFEDSDIPF